MKQSSSKILLFSFLLWTLLLWPCRLLSEDLYSNQEICFLNKEKGLSGESVSKIMTDANGQVWMLTSYGINRYNGKRVEYFRIKGGDTHAWANDICQAEDGNVYVACRAGLFVLRPGEDMFRPAGVKVSSPENLLYADHLLYIGNHQGLFVYDGRRIRHITVAPPVGLGNSVRQSIRLDNGNICFVTREAINWYFPKTGGVKSLSMRGKLPPDAAITQVASVGRKLYLGTQSNGLFVWDEQQRQLRQVQGVGNVISRIGKQGKYLLTVSTDGSGAYLVDGRNGKIIEQFNTQGIGNHHTPTNAIYCYYRDANGVNWLGYSRYGVSYTYHSPQLFTTYGLGEFTTEGLDVRSFCLNGSDVIIGTYNGLYYVDQKQQRVKYFSPDELGGAHIVTDIKWFHGRYIVSTYDGGILQINPQKLSASPLSTSSLLKNTTGGALRVSPQGQLWICTSNGLFILYPNGQLTRYTEDNAKIYGGLPTSVLFDREGNGWITFAKGLCLFSASTRQFGFEGFPNGFFNSETVCGSQRIGDRMLFYGRKAIYYTDTNMQHFGKLSLPGGLTQEGYKGCLQDVYGYYWIVSDLGLFRLNPQRSFMQHFSYGEGVSSMIVNGIQQDDKGYIWIATSNGLLCVALNRISRWMRDTRFPVVLYDVKRNGEPVEQSEEETINCSYEIDVPWNFSSQFITVKAILEDYARPNGRLYEYRMDEQKNWIIIADGKDIQLSGLFLGHHQLYIRLAGAPGTQRCYELCVKPSIWAWAEFVLFLSGIVLLILWLRYKKNTSSLLNERNEIADALVEVEDERQRAADEIDTLRDNMKLPTDRGADSPKYEHVKLDERECARLVEQMKAHLEKDKVYTNPNLKLGDLADYLHVSSSRLSQIFRLYMHENYYDFINAYRLEEFKRLINEEKDKQYTITALSEQCGFKRSNFFSTFRKSFGMTPVEYLKKMRE